jgi:hypothetical protein
VKILVWCPVPSGDQPHSETEQAINDLDIHYGWLDIVIARHNDYPGYNKQNWLSQERAAWKQTIDGGYDYLLHVDSDMIPPRNGLQLLVDTDSPVAYGNYCFRHGDYPYMNLVVPPVNGVYGTLYDEITNHKQLLERFQGKVTEVSGVGFGFVLIRREVLEQIPVHDLNGSPDVDSIFAIDCCKAGIKQVGHWGVMCGHIGENETYWPWQNCYMAECEVNDTINYRQFGETIHITKGTNAHIYLLQAKELERAGYVKIIRKFKDENLEIDWSLYPKEVNK